MNIFFILIYLILLMKTCFFRPVRKIYLEEKHSEERRNLDYIKKNNFLHILLRPVQNRNSSLLFKREAKTAKPGIQQPKDGIRNKGYGTESKQPLNLNLDLDFKFVRPFPRALGDFGDGHSQNTVSLMDILNPVRYFSAAIIPDTGSPTDIHSSGSSDGFNLTDTSNTTVIHILLAGGPVASTGPKHDVLLLEKVEKTQMHPAVDLDVSKKQLDDRVKKLHDGQKYLVDSMKEQDDNENEEDDNKNELDDNEKELDEMENEKDDNEKELDEMENEKDDIEEELDETENEQDGIEEELDETENEQDDIEEELDEIENEQDGIEELDEIENEQDESDEELDETENEKDDNEKELDETENEQDDNEEEELYEIEEELEEMVTKIMTRPEYRENIHEIHEVVLSIKKVCGEKITAKEMLNKLRGIKKKLEACFLFSPDDEAGLNTYTHLVDGPIYGNHEHVGPDFSQSYAAAKPSVKIMPFPSDGTEKKTANVATQKDEMAIDVSHEDNSEGPHWDVEPDGEWQMKTSEIIKEVDEFSDNQEIKDLRSGINETVAKN